MHLHRDLGMLDVRTLTIADTLTKHDSMRIEHLRMHGHGAKDLLMHYQEAGDVFSDHLKLSRLLDVYQPDQNKQECLRYLGFTLTSGLRPLRYAVLMQYLKRNVLPQHLALPQLNGNADMRQHWGAVLGLSPHPDPQQSNAGQRNELYIRPHSYSGAAQELIQSHNASIEEAVLFGAAPEVDHPYWPEIYYRLGFAETTHLTKLCLYDFDMWKLAGTILPVTIQSITFANNTVSSASPRFAFNDFLDSFMEMKAESNIALTEFINVQRVEWPGGAFDFVPCEELLSMISGVCGMRTQCVQQLENYTGDLEAFATPSLEIASHRLGRFHPSDIQIQRFGNIAKKVRKFGLQWRPIQHIHDSGTLSSDFLLRASGLAVS